MPEQLDLLTYQARARNTDGPMSHDAARSVKVSRSRVLVLDTLRRLGPSTDEQLVNALEGLVSPSGVRSRRHELVADSLVVEVGEGVTSTGRRCAVWSAA